MEQWRQLPKAEVHRDVLFTGQEISGMSEGKNLLSEHSKLRGMEGLEWELELDWLWPGKIRFWSLGLGLSHWEREKNVKNGNEKNSLKLRPVEASLIFLG